MDNTPGQEFKASWVKQAMEAHGPALLRYAASITGDEETARDVVQDTFVRLCDASADELAGHWVPWLFTVCRHRALDLQRKQHRMKPLAEADLAQHASLDPSPDAVAERKDALALVLRLLAGLPANQQEVVRLKFQAGLSYEQISRVTSLSVGHVGWLLHTALKTLRTRFARVP